MRPEVHAGQTTWMGTVINREHELESLETLLGQVGDRGGALILRGEAGVGKSTLLASGCDRADAAGMQVLKVAGVRSETATPFAGLHQMVRPLLEQAHELAPHHRAVLLAIFDTDNPSRGGGFRIAIATLQLLAEVAKKAPLAIAVDDAHLLDPETAEVLGFVARRLGPEPVILLMSLQSGRKTVLTRFEVPELHVTRLDENNSAALLDALAPGVDYGLRTRLLAEAAGNPLALVELPLAPRSDRQTFGRPQRLPITSRLREALAEPFFELPAPTQALLVVASIDEQASLSEIVAATKQLGDEYCASVDDLVWAANAGLAEHDHRRIHFPHPLVPAAIYESAPSALRRRAHSALAAILADDPIREAWHRAASTVGPDEIAANELARVASEEKAWRRPTMRVDSLERAGELTSDSSLRRAWLLRAAELAANLGQPERAKDLLDEIRHDDCGPLDQARIRLIREMLEGDLVRDTQVINSLVDTAVQADSAGDTDLALGLLQAAAMRSWWADPGSEVRGRIVTATRQVDTAEGETRVLSILAATDLGATPDTLEQLDSQIALGEGATQTPIAVGTALHMAGAFARSFVLLREGLGGQRREDNAWSLPHALSQQAWNAIYMGNFSLAVMAGEEAVDIARRLGQPLWESAAQAALGVNAAIRGDSSLADTYLSSAESVALPRGVSAVLADAQLGRAMIALGSGLHEEAFEHLVRTFDPDDPTHHHIRSAWRIGELAEAALHAGRLNEAREHFEACERKARHVLSPRLRVGLLYARPLFADEDDAEALFQAALHEHLGSWPLYRARLLLQYGMWLRRRRKVVQARMPLRSARDSFLALGAVPWADRARQQLRASRETHHTGPEAWVQLTEQELQIAQMASQGLSNRDIALRLYISPRTVGSHLYRIFPKLGIATRAQLASVLPRDQGPGFAS